MVRQTVGGVPRAVAAGGWGGRIVPAGAHVGRSVLPASVDPHHYVYPAQVPIGPYGFAQGIVGAGGSVTLHVGPAGYRTAWELAYASIGTTTGAADPATAEAFAQPYGTPSPAWQVGQSYAAGGDQIGLPGLKLVTGEFLFIVWTGAKPGDTATLILTGIQTVLT
jgi:hypothetical protein